MIIFHRFLCCISLKTFGKVLGWTGTMLSLVVAYIVFLVVVTKSIVFKPFEMQHFGYEIKSEDIHLKSGILIGILFLYALIHIMLICGIKYKKSLAILPSIFLAIVLIAASICVIPSALHLDTSSDDTANLKLIAIYVALLILSVYFSLCIYSLYKIIKQEEKKRKRYEDTVA